MREVSSSIGSNHDVFAKYKWPAGPKSPAALMPIIDLQSSNLRDSLQKLPSFSSNFFKCGCIAKQTMMLGMGRLQHSTDVIEQP